MTHRSISHAIRGLVIASFACGAIGSAGAATVTYSGRLDDLGNTALVSSDLSAPSFIDDFAIANNVALYTLSVAASGVVHFASTGYGLGGIDPYFTLFAGTGNGATFLDSNFSSLTSDFTLDESLLAGDYTIALGAWENMSFAENFGSGSLGDGFISLGVPNLGNPDSPNYASYLLTVTMGDGNSGGGGGGTVPEPGDLALAFTGLLAAWIATQRRRPRPTI